MKDIVNIRTQRLWPHPGNPRKEFGDLTELAESIRKNGIMQNLTVVPLELVSPDAAKKLLEKNYTVLIGHRRLAAAKLAGITEVPCRIEEGMGEREQVSTMLEKLGVGKAPDEAKSELYSGKWKTLTEFELEEDVPEQIVLPEDDRPMYYLVYYRRLLVVVKVSKKDKVMSPMEQEEKRRARAKRQIRAILKESSARRRELSYTIFFPGGLTQ